MFSKFLKLPWSKKPSTKGLTETPSKKTVAANTAPIEKSTRELIDQPISLDNLQNTDVLLEILAKHTPNQRHTALASINDEALLRQLSKQSDKLDKRSNQIVREQLKALKEREQSQKEREENLEKICLRLESLSRTSHNALFDSELFHLQQNWQHLLKASSGEVSRLMTRGDSALTRCHNIKTAAEVTATKAASIEAINQANDETIEAAPAIEVIEKTAEQLAADQEALRLSAEQQLAQKTIEAEKQQQREEKAKQRENKYQQLEQQLESELPALEKAIEDRDMKTSRDLSNTLQNAIRQLDPKRANAFSGKLQLLQNQLRELQDWQEYATLPKLEALCTSMQQMINTALPPPQKASAIRELQEQWRSMKLPTSTAAQELWTSFKKFSDEAYAPCAEYFAREKDSRAFNFAQRVLICESLELYYQQTSAAPSSINWKALSQIITTAKQEFQKFHPVERSDEKSIRDRFDAAQRPLADQLFAEYQRNEDRKQELINEVNGLLTSDDLPKAIDRTRAIQQLWKTITPCRRAQDQQLWEAFQKSCNAIFEKRQQNQQQAQQTQLDNIALADSLCEQIAALKLLDDAELSQSSEKFNELQTQFNAISDVGEKNRARLNKKFSDACDQYRQQVAGISQREQRRQQETLIRMAQLCQQLEYKPNTDTIEQLIGEWDNSNLSAKYLAILQPRYQQALAIARGESPIDYAANEQQQRQLCIELEFLTGTETPEEDRQRRRDYQMQALTKNFGQGAINHNQQIEKLTMDWFTISAAAAEIQATLQNRFDALRDK